MTIDPELAALLAVLPATDIGGASTDPVSIRAGMALTMAQLPVTVLVAQVHEADADGVPVRVYRPMSEKPLPLVLFTHGGGFVVGSVDTHDALARRLARDTPAVVVSVDYRLAPEHPFPAAVEDCWTALRWAVAHASELGADPARVAVAGDSAGGNLAAVLTQLAREAGGPALLFQLLFYPVTGAHQDWPSVTENADAPILTKRALVWFTAQYGADGSVRSAPAAATNFADLPAAFIATAGADPLRDDGEAYAALLARDGVAVQQVRYESLVHGFAGFADLVPACTAAVDEAVAAVRVALHG